MGINLREKGSVLLSLICDQLLIKILILTINAEYRLIMSLTSNLMLNRLCNKLNQKDLTPKVPNTTKAEFANAADPNEILIYSACLPVMEFST